MDENLYNQTLLKIKQLLSITPLKRINTKGMSSKEKSEKIIELEDEIRVLKIRLSVIESVYKRYINGLIESKGRMEGELLANPILTLPSGNQIQFNSLSEQQLQYLESLSQQKRK